MFIYQITCLKNQKIYIGKTIISLEHRFRQHKDCCFNRNQQTALYRAFKKYGIENFTIKQLCICNNKEQLNKAEIFFIKKYNSADPKIGYNMTNGGDGGVMNEEARIKISKSIKINHSKIKEKLSNIKIQQYIDNPEYKLATQEQLKLARLQPRKAIIYTPELRKILSDSAKKVDRVALGIKIKAHHSTPEFREMCRQREISKYLNKHK